MSHTFESGEFSNIEPAEYSDWKSNGVWESVQNPNNLLERPDKKDKSPLEESKISKPTEDTHLKIEQVKYAENQDPEGQPIFKRWHEAVATANLEVESQVERAC